MEGLHSLFKNRSGQNVTNGAEPSTASTSLSPWPLSTVKQTPVSNLRTSTPTESHPDTSLIQKLAARFVPTSAPQYSQDAIDGSFTPKSRGGNPKCQHQLFTASAERPIQKTVYFESQHEKPSVQSKEREKDGSQSALGVMILVWLINQREILKDLADLRSMSVKEQKLLLRNQENVYTQVMSLGRQLHNLQTSIRAQQQHVKAEMAYMRRILTLFGLIYLVVMVTVLSWSNKTVRGMYHNWYRHLQKSLIQPSLGLLIHCKNTSQVLLEKFSATLAHSRYLITGWRGSHLKS